MSVVCRRTFLTCFLLTISTTGLNGQDDLNIVFRTVNDEYIAFEGEDVGIQCSHLVHLQNIGTSLYYDSGEEIVRPSAMQNETHIIVTAILKDVSNSPTVHCNVNGGQRASAELTIKTLSRDMSPYCESNYTDFIMLNTVIQLSCYVDTRVPVNEQWRTSSGVSLTALERVKIFPTTRRTVSAVVPAVSDNGTKYTCVNNLQDSIISSCQVGPIFFNENIFTEAILSTTVQSRTAPSTQLTSFVTTSTVPAAKVPSTTLSTSTVPILTVPSSAPKETITTKEHLTLFVSIAAVAGGSVLTTSVLILIKYCRFKRNKSRRETNQTVDSSNVNGGLTYAHYVHRNRSRADGGEIDRENTDYDHVGSSIGWSNQVGIEFRNTDLDHRLVSSSHFSLKHPLPWGKGSLEERYACLN
ncbi:hypothetical protein HOLleu_41932 [Holothuria leucospilota]|uniref:Ig-like domain-containing protein n=1 Tax=Holothuria leucospilota TaxID=206669 RepID=A0A9Q0YEV4_HOLLE|nr:hypothetical protein HOLleu_41932 [Holothuria leucospilota]